MAAAVTAEAGPEGATMTANVTMRKTAAQALEVLSRIKGYWLLLTFLVGAVLGAHDFLEFYHRLPAVLADHEARIEALEKRVFWPYVDLGPKRLARADDTP